MDLKGKDPNGEGWVSNLFLPAALGQDRKPSASFNVRTGQVKDFGSPYKSDFLGFVQDVRHCKFPEALEWVASHIGYRIHDVKSSSYRLEDYAQEKGLSLALLKKVGFSSEGTCIKMPYPSPNGSVTRCQFRNRPGKKPRFWFEKDSRLSIVPFRVSWTKVESLFIVEGVTDTLTLHIHGFAALGMPGSTNIGVLKASHIQPMKRLYIVQEADASGHTFRENVVSRLDEVGFGGKVFVVDMAASSCKDVNDLYLSDRSKFPDAFQRLVEGAKPYKKEPTTDVAASPLARSPTSKRSQVQHLVDLMQGLQLFTTPKGDAYAVHGTTRVVSRVREKRFRQWLSHRFFHAVGKPPGSQALQDAIGWAESMAQVEGGRHTVHLRTAAHENSIYIHLGNEVGEVVRIDPSGWDVVTEYPVLFYRTAQMKALPRPRHGGSLGLLKRYIRVPSDEYYTLLYAFLLQALRPSGPYPVLSISGPQGAGKSTATRMIRALVDPCEIPIRAQPRNARDLMIAAANSWLLAYDNLSTLPHWLSDALCRLSTGGGFSTRRLTTDTEEVYFYAQNPVIINGIPDLLARPDLADRAIVLVLASISASERVSERVLWTHFYQDLPWILGALFDAVAMALARLQAVELDTLPRLADFAEWVVAGEPMLPIKEGAFLQAYATNRQTLSDTTVEYDMVASLIIEMMDNYAVEWMGAVRELHAVLENKLTDQQKRSMEWPRTYRGLGAALRRVAPALEAQGIIWEEFGREPGTGRTRYRLRWLEPVTILE